MERFNTAAYRAVIDEAQDSRHYTISEAATKLMQDTATAGYPHEVCGLLIGMVDEQHWQIERAVAIENINKERASDRFQLDPAAYQAVDRALRRSGQEIIGVFHSHPDCLARPSPTDLENAWDMFLYPIVSVCDGQVTDTAYWALNDASRQFCTITQSS
ncbi:MAG: M67 family metallopeptidase [Mariprofundaceae bacterium]|nr:M67 family metallopeptidase [Mariprofundaceae bacterium]